MLKMVSMLHDFLWGVPMLILILGIGIFLTGLTGFPQLLLFPKAVRSLFHKTNSVNSSVSPFQALCTALAATVGTGNLVGVAGAICLGGPGAVFWIWVCGFIGMATKFAEVTLAVRYRVRNGNDYIGGPMYMIVGGLNPPWKPLAVCYSLFGIVAAFGVGNAVQVNAIISGFHSVQSFLGARRSLIFDIILGAILAYTAGSILLGGSPKVGRISEKLVPFIAGGYILFCLNLLLCRRAMVADAIRSIILGAFQPKAFTGGMIGSAFRCMRVGCARGVFTNEAGMGTASIAHASAAVSHPVEQGMLGLLEVFLDTIVICTMTALAILCSGVSIPYGTDFGAYLTIQAFSTVYGNWASLILSAALSAFAFATILGWGLYGARCGAFLLGSHSWKPFVWLQMAAIIVGAIMNTESVWLLAEVFNGLMAIPNLIALTALSPELRRLTIEYRKGS